MGLGNVVLILSRFSDAVPKFDLLYSEQINK
jgi:hypothetical protein